MNHPVSEGSGFDNPLLGIRNDKFPVAAVLVCFAREFAAQRDQIFFEFVTEF